MPVRTITIYEVNNSYVSSGSTSPILNVVTLTINDDDGVLDANTGADGGTDQTFTTSVGTATGYTFRYNDTSLVGGTSQTIKTFQLVIGGTTRSFIMNDAGDSIPGATAGSSVNLQSYATYTPINYTALPCFVTGTRIHTISGWRTVENLRVGDKIPTHDSGVQTVRWAGSVTLSYRDLLKAPHMAPIVIPKGALGTDTPNRDLRLSPQHKVLLSGWSVELTAGLEEAFVPAKHLVGKNGIRVDQTCAEVTYHHILFDRHEVIVSEGLQTESFLPGDTIRNAMDKETLREILSLFPELSDPESDRQTQNARPVLKPYEIAALTMVAA